MSLGSLHRKSIPVVFGTNVTATSGNPARTWKKIIIVLLSTLKENNGYVLGVPFHRELYIKNIALVNKVRKGYCEKIISE